MEPSTIWTAFGVIVSIAAFVVALCTGLTSNRLNKAQLKKLKQENEIDLGVTLKYIGDPKDHPQIFVKNNSPSRNVKVKQLVLKFTDNVNQITEISGSKIIWSPSPGKATIPQGDRGIYRLPTNKDSVTYHQRILPAHIDVLIQPGVELTDTSVTWGKEYYHPNLITPESS